MAQSGIFELSVSGTSKRSEIDVNNYSESESSTGSISYYFGSQSAIEISFTNGRSTNKVKPSPTVTGYTMKTNYGLAGLDFIWSLAPRTSAFQPYIKLGVAHVYEKNYLFQLDNDLASIIPGETGAVPSAGLGFKFLLTQTLSLKIGIDGWTSNFSNSTSTTDYASRIGLSWFL
jgi:outer membrane autotransporter protein